MITYIITTVKDMPGETRLIIGVILLVIGIIIVIIGFIYHYRNSNKNVLQPWWVYGLLVFGGLLIIVGALMIAWGLIDKPRIPHMSGGYYSPPIYDHHNHHDYHEHSRGYVE